MYLFKQHPTRVARILGCIIALSLWPRGATAADWKERLPTEAPPKWAALEQYYSKMDVSFRKIFAIPKEGKPAPLGFIGTVHEDVRANGDMLVCTIHHLGKDNSGNSIDNTHVRCANSRYVFTLKKVAPDTETFVLSDFEAISDIARRKAIGGATEFNLVFESGNFGRLSNIIKDPGYTIKNIHGVQREGKEVVQFEYDYREETSEKQALSRIKGPPDQHGVVVVDPDRYWCILRTHFDNSNWSGGETVEYGEDMDGFPIPRRATFTSTHKKGMGDTLIIHEFDKFIHRDIPESEFTLSAFGLPEVQVPGEQKPRTLWRWLVGIGIALGAIAVLVRRYVKKRRMQQRA